MADLRDFSWTDDRDAVVLPEQPETACYLNGDGFVVIRQNNWPDDDSVVVIDRQNVRRVVEAMMDLSGERSPQRALPKPQAAPPRSTAPEASGDLLEGIANG